MNIHQDCFNQTVINGTDFRKEAPSAETDRSFSKENQKSQSLAAETVMDILQSSNYIDELKRDPDVIIARDLEARLRNEYDKLNVQKTIMELPVNERLKKYPVEYNALCDIYEQKHPKPNTGLLRASQVMCGWIGLLGSLGGMLVLGNAACLVIAPLLSGAGLTAVMLDPSVQNKLHPFLEERRLQKETRSSYKIKEQEMRDSIDNVKLVEDAALQRILHDRLKVASNEIDGISCNDVDSRIVEMPDKIEIDGINLDKKKLGFLRHLNCNRPNSIL